MAEAVFAQLVREAGLDDCIEVDSAGTGNWHIGERAHQGTLTVLRQNQIPYAGRARQIVVADLNDFDYIITMDNRNLRDVRELGSGRAKVAPLLSFAPHLNLSEVPDPYYSGGFDNVCAMVRAGAQGLIDTIRREHGL